MFQLENLENYKEKFEEAKLKLIAEGYDVVNPAEVYLGEVASWADYMRRDIKLLMDCDAIFMMKGWGQSRGACVEHYITKKLGLMIIYER